MPTRVALYGTLRRTEPDHRRLGLHRALVFTRLATVAGDLYDLGPYPGLVPGAGRVEVELHGIVDPHVVALLDGHEGHDETKPDASLFRRVLSRVATDDGAVDAWLYVYNRSVGRAPRVVGPSWPAYRRRGRPTRESDVGAADRRSSRSGP